MAEGQENIVKTNIRGKIFIISPPSYNTNSLYFASIAEDLGYEAKLNSCNDALKTIEEIKNFMPDFIVVKVTFDKFRILLEFMEGIKNMIPSVKIIATGEPFLTYNKNVTYENPYIDYVILGEAEYTLRDILDGVPNSEILGISYTDDNMQSAKNEQRPLIEDLDNLPMPARHLLKDNNEITIEVSRGCPHHCFFCIETPLNGNAMRIRTPDSIINELTYCVNKFKTKKVYFKSNKFNLDKNWVSDLCSKIISNGIKVRWSCDIVPDNIDEETVKLMKKAGCEWCRIGIESGSEEILKHIGKNTTKESIENTVALFKKFKIKTKGFYIIGLPWDTEETVKETTEFAIKLDTDDAIFNIGAPFPGTDFFVYGMLNKLFDAQTQFVNVHKKAIIKTHKLSKEQIIQLRDEAESKFYSRPKFIIKSFIKNLFFKN